MKITILGCGRWASFHAWYNCEKLKNEVLMWGRAGDPIYDKIAETKKNIYIDLPQSVEYSCDLKYALDYSNTIIISISAQSMNDLGENIKKHKPQNKVFVLCMKGLDCTTDERLSQILRKNVDKTNKICVWVGPGHIQELTKGQPNIMMIDGDDSETVHEVAEKFKSDLIRIYEGNDLIGTEVGAAAKNVMGVAAGFLDGVGYGSLKGALMSRGSYEVSRLIEAMGGNRLTAFGMAHIGDYEATLFNQNSHNRRYGELYMKKYITDKKRFSLEEFNKEIGTAEGVPTANAMYRLAQKYKIDMPITNAVYNVLYKNTEPMKELEKFFSRVECREFRY
jgi:glycerol-3-phosphate dehydrogenase (NAD(P)+)